MIEDNNLDEMFDQAVARAHNLSLQKQDCVFASLYPTLLSGALRNLVAMAVRVLIPIPFDFVVLCRRSAPLPLAYMYIECAHYPQFYAPT